MELNADMVILKTNFHNENKILVEQVVEVNNSVSDLLKKDQNYRKLQGRKQQYSDRNKAVPRRKSH